MLLLAKTGSCSTPALPILPCSVHLGFLIYMYNQALRQMSPEERLPPDGEFKPNLVNSVTYFVEAFIQVGSAFDQCFFQIHFPVKKKTCTP